MADHLVEIGVKDLHNLKDLYTPDVWKSYIAYMTIENYIRWFEQDPNLKHVQVLCLNGDYSDGTFVITVSILFPHYQFIHFLFILNILNFEPI